MARSSSTSSCRTIPGILDGSVAILPFPDAISMAPGVTDCGLLAHYYSSATGKSLTQAQQTAINGHAVTGTCALWINSFLEGLDPERRLRQCDPEVQDLRRGDEPEGPAVRPRRRATSISSAAIRRPGSRNAPLDNVGVQYGLEALNAKMITVDQFLDLNAKIGGYDIDGNSDPRS